MIDLKFKRADGTFVALVNGYPYHVIEGDEPLWTQAQSRAAEMGEELGFEPPPVPIDLPPLTRTAKADVWRRLTDQEAEALDAALLAAPLRLRRIFESAQYLDTTDADYPALRAGIVAALGEPRADEVLEPTY